MARDYQPRSGAALVTIALRIMGPEECLDAIRDAIESGDDLGHALWRPE